MEQGMALSGEEANHAEHEHEGPAPPSEVPHEPMGKKFSEDGISKGSSPGWNSTCQRQPCGQVHSVSLAICSQTPGKAAQSWL